MNKILSILSICLAILFVVIMVLSYYGLAPVSYFWWLEWIFGLPLYILIAVSFFLSVLTWLKDRTRYTFQYVIYTSLAAVLTIGTLLFVIIQFAQAMENF